MSGNLEKCLICCSNVNSVGEEQSQNKLSIYDAIFTLKMVLNVPNQLLEEFLEKNVGGEGLISVCEDCMETVKRTKVIYNGILASTKKFKDVQEAVIERMTMTRSERGGNTGEILEEITVADKCRKFLNYRSLHTKVIGDRPLLVVEDVKKLTEIFKKKARVSRANVTTDISAVPPVVPSVDLATPGSKPVRDDDKHNLSQDNCSVSQKWIDYFGEDAKENQSNAFWETLQDRLMYKPIPIKHLTNGKNLYICSICGWKTGHVHDWWNHRKDSFFLDCSSQTEGSESKIMSEKKNVRKLRKRKLSEVPSRLPRINTCPDAKCPKLMHTKMEMKLHVKSAHKQIKF